MAKLVTATLNRAYTWKEDADSPEKSYGPGMVQIPLELAERLKRRRAIDDWAEYNGDSPQSAEMPERIPPSMELAPDFPAREYLFMAGHTTYGHVIELSREQLMAIPGIGESKADQIIAARAKALVRMPQRADPDEPVTRQVSVGTQKVTGAPAPSAVRRATPKATESVEVDNGAHTDA